MERTYFSYPPTSLHVASPIPTQYFYLHLSLSSDAGPITISPHPFKVTYTTFLNAPLHSSLLYHHLVPMVQSEPKGKSDFATNLFKIFHLSLLLFKTEHNIQALAFGLPFFLSAALRRLCSPAILNHLQFLHTLCSSPCPDT